MYAFCAGSTTTTDDKSNKVMIGAAVGGAVGGVLLAVLLAVVVRRGIMKKRQAVAPAVALPAAGNVRYHYYNTHAHYQAWPALRPGEGSPANIRGE